MIRKKSVFTCMFNCVYVEMQPNFKYAEIVGKFWMWHFIAHDADIATIHSMLHEEMN